MIDSYPHLLIATEFPPNAAGGGPAVVRQMLKGWPPERLSWWSCLPERDRRFGQTVTAHRVAAIPSRLYPTRRFARQKSWILENLWSALAARHLKATIAALKPDVVWVIPHAWAIPPITSVLNRCDIPFHVTVQDYMDSRARVASLGEVRCGRLMNKMRGLYSKAKSRDATSHPMIADLKAATGRDAMQMLHAGLEDDDFEFLAKPARTAVRELRIAYAGTIVAEDAFEVFVSALKAIRNQLSLPVRLDFFAAHSYRQRAWFDETWMREHGNLPEADLTRALRECDWGFSPMDLTDEDPQYNRYSFPTKFISYLAAGLPVITLGHPESSVVKMARSYSVGLCVTTGDKDPLTRLLLEALENRNASAVFREGILKCASTEFDARKMRAQLWNCFRQSVHGSR